MLNQIKKDAQDRMEKSLEALKGHISKSVQVVHNQVYLMQFKWSIMVQRRHFAN